MTVDDQAWQTLQASHNSDKKAHQESQQSTTSQTALQTDAYTSLEERLLKEQYAWKKAYQVDHADPSEQAMIHRLQDTIALDQDPALVNNAQAGLQAWAQAVQSTNDYDNLYHKKRCKDLHDAVIKKDPAQLITADNYLYDHATRTEKRLQAICDSRQQISSQKLPHCIYTLSPQARGFMMAHDIDYKVFDSVHATSMQHCLTLELLGIVENSASLAYKHDNQSMMGQFAHNNCQLAIAAQHLNQADHIDQAVAVTDLAHFFALYGKSMLEDEGASDGPGFMAMGQGINQALIKWGCFLNNLGTQPHQTIRKMAHECYNIGKIMYNIAATVYEFTPGAYAQDMSDAMNSSMEQLFREHRCDNQTGIEDIFHQRTMRNMQMLHNGYTQSLQVAQIVIQDMMKKSAQQNIADLTEVAADGYITHNIMNLIGKLSTAVGNKALETANQLADQIPPHLYDSTMQTVQTTAGVFEVFADGTGESIAAASAGYLHNQNITKFASIIANAKELSSKIEMKF